MTVGILCNCLMFKRLFRHVESNANFNTIFISVSDIDVVSGQLACRMPKPNTKRGKLVWFHLFK